MKVNLIAVTAILSLVGCAITDGRPAPGNFVVSDQNKLKSAAHWGVVAEDVAKQFSLKSSGQPVFVAPVDTETTFNKVFSSQLKSSLVAKGHSLSASKVGAVEISITVEQVQHVTLKRYAPGTYSTLAAGVMVLRDNSSNLNETVNTLAGLAVGADVFNSVSEMTKRPDTEVVLTTVATKDGAVLMHITNVYYLDSVDASLFNNYGRQFKLVGGTK